MTALICELCGGNDFVKDNGFFVCQNCKTKYTVEEARKIILEGTVKIDHSPEEITILKNADATFEDSNYKEAFDLYSQALNINPDNPHAIMYRALSSAWLSSIKDCKVIEINNATKRAIEMQHKLQGDTKQFFDFCYDVVIHVRPLLDAISNLFIEYYNQAYPVNYSITGMIATSGLATQVRKTLTDGTTNCCLVNSNIISLILSTPADFSESNSDLWDLVYTMAENNISYRKNAKMTADVNDQELLTQISNIKEQAESEKKAKEDNAIQKYWAAHQEEQIKLNAEKEEINNSISKLEKEKYIIPGLAKKQELESKISSLKQQKSKLGLFKSKEKAEIQRIIEETETELKTYSQSVNISITQIEEKIVSAKNRLSEIDEELTRKR